jgi:hypothetical protein
MRAAILLALVLVVSCDRPPPRGAGAALDSTAVVMSPRDSALMTPRLVTGPTLIVFWLAAGDTLHPEDAASALEDINFYTEQITPQLERWGIALLPTNADTIYIALPNDKRRSVLLTGLEYPFGYVIAEPGGIERVLPGVYASEELLDELKVYFDLEDDTTTVVVEPKVISD